MSTHKRGGAFNHYGDRNQQFSKKPRPSPPPHQPALSATDMQTGLVALLDRFVAAETKPDGDKSILHHATELRRLVSQRTHSNPSAQAKRELDVKRPDHVPNVTIPDYIYRKVTEAKELPALPLISEPHLHEAVFTHRTFHDPSGQFGAPIDLSLDYERLEFLGDAYIELIASRALYNRFPQVDVPQLCSWRERLVENSALGKFSEAYGFPDRLKRHAHWDKESKSWKKIVADIFEAYVAALVLSDPTHGFRTAETWLDTLWAPQLLAFREKIIENPRARDDLQKLIFVNDVKLEFRQERQMTYDADNLQVYSMGVYLTGWGYADEWLGSGMGQNKVQGCVAAATDAIKKN
ncbi:double-strand-specific ribonuclease Pac1, partial [Dothidotthia symphoricarpi CBS 119687]